MSRKLLPIMIGLAAALSLAITAVLASPNVVARVASDPVSAPKLEMTITPTATLTPTTPLTGQNKIAIAIAQAFSVTVQDVLDVRNQDMGWGEVEKVFALAKLSGKTPAQILAMRQQGLGWGELEKQLGLHPGAGENLGQVIKSNKDNQASGVHPDQSKSSHQEDDKDKDKDKDTNHNQDKGKGHDPDDHKPNDAGKDNSKHKGGR